jgi:tRNA (cytidine/uridine-2'-O-)-methyltransferase
MPLHVVLYQPEIPQNTGNIMRTCAAVGARLHLIEPLGFSLSKKHLERSVVDYLPYVDFVVHPDWETFVKDARGSFVFLTRYGSRSPDRFDMSDAKEDLYLVFGRESTGLPKALLQSHLERCARLPMKPEVRSLNLANTVAVVVYEVLRQQGYPDLSLQEPESLKGADWLLIEDPKRS